MNNKNSVKHQVALLQVQVRSIIDEANASMPAERQVHLKSALAVVKRSLNTTRSLAFEVREFQALRELSSFITLSQKNKSLNAHPKNTDLLPVGHPVSTATHAMTASALRNAQVQWILSDTRISDEAKPLLASAFDSAPDSPQHKYAMARLGLMTESKVPLEALVAAFGDGNSTAARRARAMLQRRDRKGRFAYQGGGISALIKRANGVVERLTGHTVSNSPDGKTVRVELPNGKLVDVPVDSGEFIKAIINPSADGFSGVAAKHSVGDTVVDEASLQYFDAPHGFEKDTSYTGAGQAFTDDSYNVVKNEDGTFSISQRGTGVDLGTANSWSEVQKTLQNDDENLAKAEGSQPIARLTDQQIDDMYDESKNPLDIKSPYETPEDTTPAKGAPEGFEYSYPDGAYKLSPQQDDWEPEGNDGQDSTDYTDDPKVLAGKYKAEGLVSRLKMAILPKKEGDNATGYAPLPFNEGLEQVPAEAVYAALDEKGLDAKMEVAKIYDEALGTTENQDALTAAREEAKTATPEATLPEDVIPVEPEKGKGEKEAELPKPDVEDLPLTTAQKIAWFIEAFASSKTGFFDTPKPTNQMIYEYVKDADVPHEDLIKALEDAGIEIAPDPEADITSETPEPESVTPEELVEGAPEPVVTPEPTNEPDVADIVDEISSSELTDEEIQAMIDGEGIGDGEVPGVFVPNGNMQEIPFDTSKFVLDDPANPNGPGHIEKSSGTSNIIDFAGRKIVIVDVNGVKVPFYLSTGDGGKKNVPAGKWYPFLGVGSDGWINKDGQKMTDYYGSPELKAQAEWLDANIGDVRKDDTIPKVSPTGSHIDAINADLMTPTDNGTADTQKNIDAAVADLVERVKTEEIATPEEVKSKKASEEVKAVLPEAPIQIPEETPAPEIPQAPIQVVTEDTTFPIEDGVKKLVYGGGIRVGDFVFHEGEYKRVTSIDGKGMNVTLGLEDGTQFSKGTDKYEVVIPKQTIDGLTDNRDGTWNYKGHNIKKVFGKWAVSSGAFPYSVGTHTDIQDLIQAIVNKEAESGPVPIGPLPKLDTAELDKPILPPSDTTPSGPSGLKPEPMGPETPETPEDSSSPSKILEKVINNLLNRKEVGPNGEPYYAPFEVKSIAKNYKLSPFQVETALKDAGIKSQDEVFKTGKFAPPKPVEAPKVYDAEKYGEPEPLPVAPPNVKNGDISPGGDWVWVGKDAADLKNDKTAYWDLTPQGKEKQAAGAKYDVNTSATAIPQWLKDATPEGWTPRVHRTYDWKKGYEDTPWIEKTLEDGTRLLLDVNADGTYTISSSSSKYTMSASGKTHTNPASAEEAYKEHINQLKSNHRSDLAKVLEDNGFDQATIDAVLNSPAEEAKKAVLDSARYKEMQAKIDENAKDAPFAASNTIANYNKFKKTVSDITSNTDKIEDPLSVDESKIESVLPQDKPEVLTPTNAPVAMTEKIGDPVKVTTSVSDLQAGDVLASDFFTVESVYSDAESEAKKPGSVWVTGYYPGHASQKTKLWLASDSREVFRNVDVPAKGDLPELSKPFAKDYDPQGKVYKDTALDLFVPKDAEARSKYLDAVDQYNAALKEAMGKWTPPADAPSHDATATDPNAPHKLSVPASELQPGDIAFRTEDPGYSGGVLKEPYTNYFVIEEVFTDENTPAGKVNVRGYYPGHVSQVREWNKDTPIDAVRGDKNVPEKGDGPELVLKKQKEYPVDPTTKKMTPETRAEWLKNVEDFHAGAKSSADKYSDPVGDYVAGDTSPVTSVATAPQKPGRAPAQPAFQGDRLTELAKQANGDPKKFMELLSQEEIAFFDYETVGDGSFGPDSAPIQLAAHKIKDGKVIDSFDMFINPGKPLGEYYYEAELDGNGKQKKDANKKVIFILDEDGNKILKGNLKTPDGEPVNDEWLAQQPTLEEAHKAFAEWLGEGAILGGQNITGFDIPILKYQFDKAGLEFNAGGIVDTLPLAQSITKVPPHTKGVNTLEGLAARYGIDLTNAHNAAADSLATHGVLFAMLDEVSKTNDAEALTHLDPETKFAEYEGKFADWQANREAYKAWTAAQALKDAEDKIAQGQTVTVDDLIKSASVPEVPNPDGVFDTKSDAVNTPDEFPTGPALKDSPEWVKDDENTTLIEDTIRPVDFKVGDFIPAEFGGFHEILSIEEDPNKKDFFNIATRVVGTDKTYVKNWFKYNKNYSGVRRPNNSLDGSEMPVIESPEAAPAPMPEAPAKWNNYDIKQNDHGNFYADGITSEDAIKLRTGELQPPSLPFFVPMYGNTDPNSGDGDLYTEQSIVEGGPRKYWGQFGGAGIIVRRKNADGNYEYLLARRQGTSSGSGKWAYFGGAHDTAEAAKDPESTVLKELGEEAGIDLTGKATFAHTHDSTGDPDWSYKTFIADVAPDAIGPDDIKTNWEHSEHGWFTADQIKDMGSKGLLFGPFAGSAEAILNTSSDESNLPATPAPEDAVATATPKELGTVFDVSGWKKVGTAGGSTGGAIYEDQNGNTFFVKPPNNVDDTSDPERHARNEALASALYEEAGVKSGRVFLGKDENGNTVLVSPWIDGSTKDFKDKLSDPAVLAKAQEAFAVDAWLMNWDSVGLGYDNMLMVDGDVVRVDPGGSLLYRARGKSKQEQMSDKVTELDSLRSGQNAQAAKVFGSMTDAQLADSAKLVQAITPERINQIVDAAFPDDKETADFLKQKLTARRQDLIDRFNLGNAETTPIDTAELDKPILSPEEAIPSAPIGLKPEPVNPETPSGPTHTVDTSTLDPQAKVLAETYLNDPDYADWKIENYSSPEDGSGFSLTDPSTGVTHVFAYKEGVDGAEGTYSAHGTFTSDGEIFHIISPTFAESIDPKTTQPLATFKNPYAAVSAFNENVKEQKFVFVKQGMFEEAEAEKQALQTTHLDPSTDLTKQIADAIDAGKMVAFKYHDKERLVTPHGTWENPQNGNINFSATEMIDGKPVKKTFTLSKLEKSDNAPSTPDATVTSSSSLDITKLPVPMKKLAEKYMALPKYSKWKFENFDKSTGASEGETGLTITDPESGIKYQFSYNDGTNGENPAFSAMAWVMDPDGKSMSTLAPKDESGKVLAPGTNTYEFEGIEQARQRFDALMKNSGFFTAAVAKNNEAVAKKQEGGGDQVTPATPSTTPTEEIAPKSNSYDQEMLDIGQALKDYLFDAVEGNENYIRVTTSKGDSINLVNQGDGTFDIVVYSGRDVNGEEPIDVGSYDNLTDATGMLHDALNAININNNSAINPVPIPDLFIESEEDSQTPISDIVTTALDGGDVPIPSVDEIVNETAAEAKAKAVTNPDLIVELLKKNHPDHVVLSNDDLLVRSKKINGDTYDTIVRRNSDNTFSVYLRETNGITGDVREVHYAAKRHSELAINNLINNRNAALDSKTNPKSWFTSKKAKKVETPSQPSTTPTVTQAANDVIKPEFPQTGDLMIDGLLKVVEAAANEPGGVQKVLDSLQNMPGISKENFDKIMSIVNTALAKQSASVPVPDTEDYNPYVSKDGKTIVKIGDTVRWEKTKDGVVVDVQIGVVEKYKKSQVTINEYGEYIHDDYVTVRVPGYAKALTRVSSNLEVLSSAPDAEAIDNIIDTAELDKPILPPSQAIPSGPSGLKPEPMGPETPKTPDTKNMLTKDMSIEDISTELDNAFKKAKIDATVNIETNSDGAQVIRLDTSEDDHFSVIKKPNGVISYKWENPSYETNASYTGQPNDSMFDLVESLLEDYLGKSPVGTSETPSAPETPTSPLGKIHLDPAGDLKAQIQDAIDNNREISFLYDGKERSFIPEAVYTHHNTGNDLVNGFEGGHNKKFMLAKVEKSADFQPYTPSPEKPKTEATPEEVKPVNTASQIASEITVVTPSSFSAAKSYAHFDTGTDFIVVPNSENGLVTFWLNRKQSPKKVTDIVPGDSLITQDDSGEHELWTVLKTEEAGDAYNTKFTVVKFNKENETHEQKNLVFNNSNTLAVLSNEGDDDNGGGGTPPEVDPINPSDNPATVQETADILNAVSEGIKNDPAMSGVDTASMDDAVDAATKFDEEGKNPSAEVSYPELTYTPDASTLEEWQKFVEDNYVMEPGLTKMTDLKPNSLLLGGYKNSHVVVVSTETLIAGGSFGQDIIEVRGFVLTTGESVVKRYTVGSVANIKNHKDTIGEDPYATVPAITHEETKDFKKKTSAWQNIKKLSYDELKVGDVFVKKTGPHGYSYQILSITPSETRGYPTAVIRFIPHDPTTFPVSSGQLRYDFLNKNGGYSNVKRPKQEWFDKAAKAAGVTEKPNTEVETTVKDGISIFNSVEDLTANALGKKDSSFLELFGANAYDTNSNLETVSFKQGTTGLLVKDSGGAGSGKNILPGIVVKDSKGNSGIVTNTYKAPEHKDSTLDVTWLSGPDAGSSQSGIKAFDVTSTEKFIKYDEAAKLGVDVNSDVMDKIKSNLSAISIQQAAALKLQKEEAEAKKVIEKLKNENQVQGSGSAPVVVSEAIDWSSNEFSNIPNLPSVIEAVQSDIKKGSVGVQTLVDSDSIEDNTVRVYRVQDKNGDWRTRVRFKLTDWAGVAKAEELISSGVSGTNGIEFRKYEKQIDGSIRHIGKHLRNWIDESRLGTTYTLDIKDEQGNVIGETLIHRATKTAETINYKKSAHGGYAASYNNEVDIYLPDNATPQQVEQALKQAGVSQARPATEADIRILAENKIIGLFTDKADGSKNYKGELREKVLQSVKDRWGIDATDIKPEVINNGDIVLLMPEDVAEKIAIETKSPFFVHSWQTNAHLPPYGQPRAEFFFDLLTGDGLRSTVDRWAAGINVEGKSSKEDGYAVGANYIFTSKSTYSSGTFNFDGKKLLRRLDFYANSSDSFGKKSEKDVLEEMTGSDIYEILFKGTISWSDLSRVHLDIATRDILLDMLAKAGIGDFGGTPITEIFGL